VTAPRFIHYFLDDDLVVENADGPAPEELAGILRRHLAAAKLTPTDTGDFVVD
jgi:hypothetical protein